MKVIAKTKDGYLMDVNREEIATIQGMSWVDRRFKYPEAGDEFDISKVYSIVSNLASDYDIKNLAEFSKQLNETSKWLSNFKSKLKSHVESAKYQPD